MCDLCLGRLFSEDSIIYRNVLTKEHVDTELLEESPAVVKGAVPWGIGYSVGGVQYRGGYHEYSGDVLSTMGDILSTMGMFSTMVMCGMWGIS